MSRGTSTCAETSGEVETGRDGTRREQDRVYPAKRSAHRSREQPQSPTHRLVDRLLDQLNREFLGMIDQLLLQCVIALYGGVDVVERVELVHHVGGDFDTVALGNCQRGSGIGPESCVV
jgi:hypothetical protein